MPLQYRGCKPDEVRAVQIITYSVRTFAMPQREPAEAACCLIYPAPPAEPIDGLIGAAINFINVGNNGCEIEITRC
jgi:hypothetical protein